MVDKPPSRNPKSGTAPAAGHGTAEASVGGAQTGAGVAIPAQSSEPADEYLGKTFGKYQVTKRLGNGGMAVVYLADDLVMKRQVAIKFLSSMFFHKPAAIERFMREAQVAGRLNHPNIIAIHDVSREEHACYIVMELLSPGSAGQHLNHKGPYYWVVATRIIADCCAALKVAHDAGVIHRDIKPDERLTVWDARWRCRASTLERGEVVWGGHTFGGFVERRIPAFFVSRYQIRRYPRCPYAPSWNRRSTERRQIHPV